MTRELKLDYPYLEDFGGTTQQILNRVPDGELGWSAFNPSIGRSPDGNYAILVRSSNYIISEYGVPDKVLSAIKNNLWFSELDSNFNLLNLRKITVTGSLDMSQGVEDARLFWRDGGWHFTAVTLKQRGTLRQTRINLFKLNVADNNATHIKQYKGIFPTQQEKNWMPVAFDENPNFDFIYGPFSIVKDDKFIYTATDNDRVGNVRGGSCLVDLGDKTYIAILHSTYTAEMRTPDPLDRSIIHLSYKRSYTHQFARYDWYGKLIELSEEFVFDGLSIEFAAGLVEKDGKFIISYGREDVSCHLATIDRDTVLSLLDPVDEDF